MELTRKDDSPVWTEMVTTLFRNDHGGISVAGVSRDITGRKRAEEAHLRLVTAVEQAAEAIIITDPEGTILYANPAFTTTTGYSREEAIGQNPRILKSGKHDAGFYQQMWAVLSKGEVWSGRLTNKRKDGTLFDEQATISPVRDRAGRVINYVAVKRDVTREIFSRPNSGRRRKWNPSASSPAAWRTTSTTFSPRCSCKPNWLSWSRICLGQPGTAFGRSVPTLSGPPL